MERTTLVFWVVFSFLLGSSAFYGFSAEQRRSKVQNTSGVVSNGDLVQLVDVLDGDSLLVSKSGAKPVGLRLVGIKAFEAKIEKDIITPFAQAGVELLKRELAQKTLRVSLSALGTQDKYGRYLATLYLQEQELAQAKKRGLWSNQKASERAMAQMREWRTQAE